MYVTYPHHESHGYRVQVPQGAMSQLHIWQESHYLVTYMFPFGFPCSPKQVAYSGLAREYSDLFPQQPLKLRTTFCLKQWQWHAFRAINSSQPIQKTHGSPPCACNPKPVWILLSHTMKWRRSLRFRHLLHRAQIFRICAVYGATSNAPYSA